MNKKFSKTWKGSKRPGKQRKYVANAPIHTRKKFISVNLAKALREKAGKRNIPVKKGDKVKVLRGKFKGKEGKILEVRMKTGRVIVEGIQVTKMDNSKANVKMQPSNLQIIEMADRKGKVEMKKTKEVKKEKQETKTEKTKENKK